MFSRHLLCLIALLGLAQPAGAAVFGDFAVQTSAGFTGNGGNQVSGRLAIGGDAAINSDALGVGLGAAANNSAVVIVGGTVRYDNAALANGSVIHAGANLSGQWTQAKTPNGSFIQGTGADFAALAADAASLSQSLAGRASTGSFSSQWGAGTLTAGTAGLNVFNLSAQDFSAIYSLKFVGQAGDKAIVNVAGGAIGGWVGFDSGGLAAENILFNFHTATSATLGGWDLPGSVLAPFADIVLNGGNIRGSVVAHSVTAGGATIGGRGFAGGPAFYPPAMDLPTPMTAVPEPTGWALMMAGFGLVGTMVRRRPGIRRVSN